MANDIQKLRAEVLAKQRKASQKVSRLKSRNGANIAGTELDPRRDKEVIGRLNTRQLQALSQRLDQFNSRRTQYYGGLKGTVIDVKQKRKLRYAEQAANKRNAELMARVSDIMIKPARMTIGERMKGVRSMRSPIQQRLAAANDPFAELSRKLSNISGKGIDRIVDSVREQSKPEFFSKVSEAGREQFMKMLDTVYAEDLRLAVADLTTEQFGLLWHFTKFATIISASYESITRELGGHDSTIILGNSDIEVAREYVEWAKTVKL